MNLSLIAALATTSALVACHQDHHGAPPTTAEPMAVQQTKSAAAQPAAGTTQTRPSTVVEAALADGKVSRNEHNRVAAAASDALQRLQALKIVDVGALVVDAPQASFRCYGPCEGDPATDAWMLEHARQTRRLESMVAVASELRPGEPADVAGRLDAALVALRSLEIVEIAGVHIEAGRCYGLGCPEAVAATVALADAMAAR